LTIIENSLTFQSFFRNRKYIRWFITPL
jgi:hypothetical protein